jgi:hypothetical protein
MNFEVCSDEACASTKIIMGDSSYWTYRLSSNTYQIMMTIWAPNMLPLGAGPNDDYFTVGHIFMEKYYTIFSYE